MKNVLLDLRGSYVPQTLSREQLKNIRGGVVQWVNCVWTYANGMQATVPCSYSADYCQDTSDGECDKMNSCADVNCGAK